MILLIDCIYSFFVIPFDFLLQKKDFAQELNNLFGENDKLCNELRSSEKVSVERLKQASERLSTFQQDKEKTEQDLKEAEEEENTFVSKVSSLEQQVHKNDEKINDLRKNQFQTVNKESKVQRDEALCDLLENVTQIQFQKCPTEMDPTLEGIIVKDSEVELFSFNTKDTAQKEVIAQLWNMTSENTKNLQMT